MLAERVQLGIEGRRLVARPSGTRGPAAALFRAYCAGCGAEYTGPWRLERRSGGTGHAG